MAQTHNVVTLCVALRKESVDRNDGRVTLPPHKQVALRKESVDRNVRSAVSNVSSIKSLSARRAWIEILDTLVTTHVNIVALRKESVDRNAAWTGVLRDMHRRSPQGERG